MSRPAYVEAATKIYMRLLPARDRVTAAEASLKKLLRNATTDKLDAKRIEDEAFDAASKALAAKATHRPVADMGLEGTPLGGVLLATTSGEV